MRHLKIASTGSGNRAFKTEYTAAVDRQVTAQSEGTKGENFSEKQDTGDM